MRSLATALLAVLSLSLGATDKPDADFEARVEKALAAIQARQAEAVQAEYASIIALLTKAGVQVPERHPVRGEGEQLDLSAVQLRQVRFNGSRGMGLGFANEAAAKAAVARMDVDAIVAGRWVFTNLGPAADLTELAGAMGGRIYSADTHELGLPVPAPAPGVASARANERAVVVALKTAIFAGLVQFQGGGYLDLDQDNIGEYGLLGQLAGRIPTDKMAVGQLKFMQGPLAQADEAHGYRFKTWLPGADAASAVSTWPEIQALKTPDANLRERYFAVYAWPASGSTGTVFVITNDGQVRSQAWDGKEPVWNAVFGGQGWEDKATWTIVPR
jgi:hypothetical protein